MTIGKTGIHLIGETPYPWEKEAVDFAIKELPSRNPYQLWALTELLDPSTGRLYEIDLLIIGYGALYLVEVKSGPGIYKGDQVDWFRTPPGEPERWMEAPYPLANKKAKILRSRLEAKMKGGYRAPWVQPLVFLSNENINLALTEEGRTCVVTRDTFSRAIVHGEFPGIMSKPSNRRIDDPHAREIARAIEAVGIRSRKGKATAGSFLLDEVLLEGAGYQDRTAVHKDQKTIRRRARIYLVPDQTSLERRQQLRRAADREALLLNGVREHENVLTCTDYVSDAPLGPTLLFDDFEGGVPLDAFLRNNSDLKFLDRIEIVLQTGRALSYCHKKDVLHGDVSPYSVLVRRNSDNKLEVRLFNFQMGHGDDAESTRHLTAFLSERESVYSAPEYREGIIQRSVYADIFSLGALAFFTLTGTHPGERPADVEAALDENNCLDPSLADETIAMDVADSVKWATCRQIANRPDDVGAWIAILEDAATSPSLPDAPLPVNALEAKKGDILNGNLEVVGILGHGATSRVLKVKRDNGEYALKVSLSEAHDDLLRQEGNALLALRHANIVQLYEILTVGERTALLLAIAGENTMQIELRKQGSIAPEYVMRYGEQLLSILEYLEEEGLVHKDIKPANLGTGDYKRKGYRLTLFDFSLVHAPSNQVRVGTAVYRDPFLKERGAWDAAADRWSAAITLHEALTGIRPELQDPGETHSKIVIAAERFDPAFRDRLTDFFNRAFLVDSKERFSSASKMAQSWRLCFEDNSLISIVPAAVTDTLDTSSQTWSPEILSSIEPETMIETLPLPPLARSALDRAGLTRAVDLISLPDNRLSAVRGVGRAVTKVILDFRREWIEAKEIKESAVELFYPGYRGEDLKTNAATVDEKAVFALRNAGILSLVTLAQSPKCQIENLAVKYGFAANELLTFLATENQKADELSRPSTLEGWIGALFPDKAFMQYPRQLYGLEAPFEGRLDVMTKEAAEKANVTAATISISMGKAREKWASHGAINELRAQVREVVDETGGAVRLKRAAEMLLERLPHNKSTDQWLLCASAAALIRAAAETEKDEIKGLHCLRLKDGCLWVLAEASFAKVVRDLGAAADQLANRYPLASPGETERRLRDTASGSVLSQLPAGQLAAIAAEASQNGARSSRLEIYPRDIEWERLLELSATQLRSGLTPAEVVNRVRIRFPEAKPLPERPKLDALLEPHELYWNEEILKYERQGESHSTSLVTHFTSMTRLHTALPNETMDMSEEAIEAREFDDKISAALERRSFRLIGVTADQAVPAALALAAKMQVPPTSFDKLFLTELNQKMNVMNVKRETVLQADREGPEGQAWRMLTSFAAEAADEVALKIFPAKAPLLLVQPGLTARYGLNTFLEKLVQSASDDKSEAVFLLVPCKGTRGTPRINGELAVPGVRASQVLWAARSWIANMHKAAATKEAG